MIGTSHPRSATRRTISGSAEAASSLLTVTRTSCDPALAKAATWSAVAGASAVSVFVIDWTTIGYAPPTGTSRIQVVVVLRRCRGVTKYWDGSDERLANDDDVLGRVKKIHVARASAGANKGSWSSPHASDFVERR